MKRWRRWTAAKALVYLICLALVAPYFPAQAFAQESPEKVKVAVTSFEGDFGKQLAEATRIALRQSSRLEPVGRPEIVSDAARFGHGLGADIVLKGVVASATKDNSSRAAVEWKGEAVSVLTGKTVARFHVRGASVSKVGYQGDRQALMEQAINDAALNLSQEVATSLTASGVVLMVRDDTVRINLGKQDSLHVGAEIAVLSDGEEVATLVVTEVDTASAQAKISSGDIKQVNVNDKVRVKYNPPAPVKQVKKSNNGMAVLGLILLAALVAGGGKGGGGGGGGGTPPPTGSKQYNIETLQSANSVIADGKSTVTIDITITDKANHLVPDGTVVKLDTTLGAIPAQATTTDGKAQALLRSGTTAGTANVKVTVGPDVKALSIQFQPLQPPGEPATIDMLPSALTLLADGVSKINIDITVRDIRGGLVPDGTAVRLGATLGVIEPAQGATKDGKVQATLTSGTTSGTAIITATAGSVNKQQAIEFLAATPAVMQMSANPQEIQVTQTGGPELATITATVKDDKGNPISTQKTIVFTILGAPNGATLTRKEVGTQNGVATSELKSGKVAGTIRVQASVKGEPEIAAAQTSVVVHAGPPFYLDFGIDPLNIAGLVYVNETSKVGGFVSDVYKNPVPDGTAVYFTTDSGMIAASSLTIDGFFQSNIYSGDPYPPLPHLVTVTASTRKESGAELNVQRRMLWSGPTAPIIASIDSFDLDNGESTTMMVTVSDIYGNPIVGGSQITASGSGAGVSGDVNIRVQDSATPGLKTVLFVTIQDPNDEEFKPRVATVTIRVTSRNGDRVLNIPGSTK